MSGTSLGDQWLRLHAPSARGQGSIPGQVTRAHMRQPTVLMSQIKDPTYCH